MIETALLVYLLLMWSESLIVHETLDDRDSSNFVRETSFIFDLRSMRCVHKIITVDIILYRPTRSAIIVIVRHGSTRAVQVYTYTYYIVYVPTTGTSIQYLYIRNTDLRYTDYSIYIHLQHYTLSYVRTTHYIRVYQLLLRD